MITTLWRIFCTSSNEDSTIVCLDGAKSDWNVKLNIQQLSGLFVLVYVVESDHSLIKFEKMDPIRCLSYLRISWAESFNPLNCAHRSLHHIRRRLLLDKKFIHIWSRMHSWSSSTQLNIWLETWVSVTESKITSRRLTVLISAAVIETHIHLADWWKILVVLVTYRIKVLSRYVLICLSSYLI